jgi:K+-transporting ATPase c subunit
MARKGKLNLGETQRCGAGHLPAAPGSEEAAMSLSANDEFLGAIAQQAQVAYASQQLHVLQDMLQDLLTHSGAGLDIGVSPRAQHELVYYTQQIERWQEYMERLVGLGALC